MGRMGRRGKVVVELTDPATELAELTQRQRSGKAGPNGFTAIAGVLKVNPNDTTYLDLLAIIRQPTEAATIGLR